VTALRGAGTGRGRVPARGRAALGTAHPGFALLLYKQRKVKLRGLLVFLQLINLSCYQAVRLFWRSGGVFPSRAESVASAVVD